MWHGGSVGSTIALYLQGGEFESSAVCVWSLHAIPERALRFSGLQANWRLRITRGA